MNLVGNITFIFDSSLLSENHINGDELLDLNKDDLKKLIEGFPGIGQSIRYSRDYIPHILEALSEHAVATDSEVLEQLTRYLSPPEEVLSENGIAKNLGVSSQTVQRATEVLKEALGEANYYRFGSNRVIGYTLEQRALIRAYLESKGLFTETAPDEVLSYNGIAKNFGISHGAVQRAVEVLKEDLGETKYYRFGRKRVAGYTSGQQAIIQAYLESTGLLVETAPEDILSEDGIAKNLGVSSQTVQRAAKVLEEDLGEAKYYRFGPNRVIGYTPGQQAIIQAYLESTGLLVETAPENIFSVGRIAKNLGVRWEKVQRATEVLKEDLGETEYYRFGSKRVIGYTLEQRAIIQAYLESKGLLMK
jgi:DNA-binding transcriptional regulator YhcF (GntR family)